MVGTSGNCGERLSPVIASARNCPDRMRAMELGRLSMTNVTCPASRAETAGDIPLNGMWVIVIPARWVSISADKCGDCPVPEEPKE